MPRTIAIGDIHGCRAELEDLLSKISPAGDDRIIFLGDLVNRGPDSAEVLELVRGLKNRIALLGNHEWRLRSLRRGDGKAKIKAGDRALAERLHPQDWELIDQMPTTFFSPELETVFVHGGFLPDTPWQTQPAEVVTRIQVIDADGNPRKRSECPTGVFWADIWQHSTPFVIYGHTPRPSVYARPNSLCIDTGCVYGGHLTAYILPEGRLVQVPARQKWIS